VVAAARNGTTYVVHNEALPKTPGEKCNCSFTSGNGHQHQYTYVAVVGKRVTRSGTTGSSAGKESSGGAAAGGGSLASTGLGAALPVTGLLMLVAAVGLRRRTTSLA
jgi:hypothetical protein